MPKAANRGAVLKDFLAFWEKSLEGPCSQLPLLSNIVGRSPCAPVSQAYVKSG
jgi:uncharacterized protein Usg